MKRQIPYAQLGLPVLFLIVTGWYLIDSYKASATTENLLLILPAGIVVLALSLWILVGILKESSTEEDTHQQEEEEEVEEKQVSVIGAMVILAAYILSMDWIGFDVATFLFIGALMFHQGERRILWLTSFSFVFAFLVSLFFQYMIPYPMPMLIGKEFIERLL